MSQYSELMGSYSELMGSFIRNANFPLEADYIFDSKELLDEYAQDEFIQTILHKGWFKIVLENDKQSLFWVVEKDGKLQFTRLISESNIDEIFEHLTKLDEEVKECEKNEEEILNNLEYVNNSLKSIVGSEESIPEYLQTLDYKNLTEISNDLNKFLNTYDDEDSSINTLPELKEFLFGYDYKHNLQSVLEDLWNRIEGDPTPNLRFRTLRGILDFITELALITKTREDNLQTELNQTQTGVGLDSDGSYSPDLETKYLKNATSVMNALKTLDSLIDLAINNCNIIAKDTESVSINIIKESDKTTISAQVKLSSDSTNDILKKTDGLYHNIDTEYEDGILTVKVNGNVRKQHILGLTSVVEDAYYDSDQEAIIIIFKLLTGGTQNIKIPTAALITEWMVDNSISNKVVELTRERVISGSDKLSADVRISPNKYNILEKEGNTLLVEGLSDNIIYDGDVTVKTKLDLITSDISNTTSKLADLNSDLNSEVSRAKIAEQGLSNDITNLRTDVEVKDLDLLNSINTEKIRAEAAEKVLDNKIETVKTNIEENVSSLISLLLDALTLEINRSTTEDSKFNSSLNLLNTDVTLEIERASNAEENLGHRIDDITSLVETNTLEISKRILTVELIKLDNLNYSIFVDGSSIGTITIPEDQFLKDVSLIDNTLRFVFNTESGLKVTDINLKDIIDSVLENVGQDVSSLLSSISEILKNLEAEIRRALNAEEELGYSITAEANRAIQREDFLEIRMTDHINDHNNPHLVTADLVNAYTKDKVDELLEHFNDHNSSVTDNILQETKLLRSDIDNHILDYSNPHKVTKEQIGLNKVDNTSDLEKPISVAVQDALNKIDLELAKKATLLDFTNHINDHSNPHSVTKELVGLSNVDNTSDINKPISLATQMALDKKSDVGHTHTMADITDLENMPIIKGFVDLLVELPEDASGGDKYILKTQVNSGVTRYTLMEYDGATGTWKLKLLTTGGIAAVIDGDVWKLNSSGIERVLDVSDYTYFYNKIYDETKNLIEDIDWEEDDEHSDTNQQIRLKITYKTSYGDPNELEVTNPYQKKNVKYIDIDKARFLSDAYSRPARLSDVDDGYATTVGEPLLILVMTTGDYVTISLKDSLNIYDPVDTPSVDMEVSDWTGDPSTSYKVSANLKIASTEDAKDAITLHVKNTSLELGLYSSLHTSNTNSISLNPSTGNAQKTLTADLNINNLLNELSDVKLTIDSLGLSAKIIWGEYD